MIKLFINGYLSKLMLCIWLIGIISGTALVISSITLNFWLAKEGIDKVVLGLFSFLSFSYSINFFWAFVIDTYKIPIFFSLFGRNKSWIIVLGALLSLLTFLISSLNPKSDIIYIAVIAFLLAFVSSSLDVALGAVRSSIIKDAHHGPASGVYIFGYRVGMLIGKSGAIYLSYYLSWNVVYKFLAVVILSLLFLCLIFIPKEEPEILQKSSEPKINITKFFKKSLLPLGSLNYIITIFILLILYRLPDNLLNPMLNPFFLEKGFNESQIALYGYLVGSVASVIGGMIAGVYIAQLGIYQALLYFGVIHSLTHLLLVFLNNSQNELLLSIIIGAEGLTNGMSMTSYIALITFLCKGKYKATQYSILSSTMGLSRTVFASVSGVLAITLGWINFFIFITLATIPSLYIIKKYLILENDSNKIK